MTASETTAPTPTRRGWGWVLVVPVGLVFVGGLWGVTRKNLSNAVAKIEEAADGVRVGGTLEEHVFAEPSDGSAAPHFAAIARDVADEVGEEIDASALLTALGRWEALAELDGVVESWSTTLGEVRAAAKASTYRWEIGLSEGWAYEAPDLSHHRGLAALLAYHAMAVGTPDESLEVLLTLLGYTRALHLAGTPEHIAGALEVERVTSFAIRRVLLSRSFEAEDYRALLKGVLLLPVVQPGAVVARASLRGQVGLLRYAGYEVFGRGSDGVEPRADAPGTSFGVWSAVRSVNALSKELVQVAETHPRERLSALEGYQGRLAQESAFVQGLVPELEWWTDYETMLAGRRVLGLLVSAHMFNARHGGFPADLEAFHLSDEVRASFVDPFATDEALVRYRCEGPVITVYSVGPDGEDQGGLPAQAPEEHPELGGYGEDLVFTSFLPQVQ